MKKRILTLSLIGLFLLSIASCSASKGSSRSNGHCPAYGN